jgi:hypothetical protein
MVSDQPSSASLVDEPGSSIFVWSIWLVMLAIGFWFVGRFGPDVPLWDDYDVIPQLVGAQPVTLSWLWSQHNEHRIPLPRIILLEAFRFTGGNPRIVMFLIVLLVGAVAAGLMEAVRRARGGRHYVDAFLPILLLNLGHHENFLWSMSITYVLPVVLMAVVLCLIVRQGGAPSLRSIAAAASCLALMPLCNAGGLAFIPAMSLWLGSLALAWTRFPSVGGRFRGLLILALSAPALILALLYFSGYEATKYHAAPAGCWAVTRTSAQFLAMALGRPAVILWPLSGLVVVGLMLASTLVLGRAWILEPKERMRVFGLVCAVGAVASLALGTGWGRSGEGDLAGLQMRYTMLAAPTLVVSYLAFACYGPGTTRNLIPAALFSGVCLLLWPNTQEGVVSGRSSREQAAAFNRDLASGTPLFRLVRRNTPFLHPSQEALYDSLRMLHRAGIGRFQMLREDPKFQEQPVRLTPAEIQFAHWNDGLLDVIGIDPWIRFDLPGPTPVSGIQVRYTHSSSGGVPARFRIAWRRPGQLDFPSHQQYGNWNLPTESNRSMTVWVDDVVSQIRIQPDNRPCRFLISKLTLLVPRSQSLRPAGRDGSSGIPGQTSALFSFRPPISLLAVAKREGLAGFSGCD